MAESVNALKDYKNLAKQFSAKLFSETDMFLVGQIYVTARNNFFAALKLAIAIGNRQEECRINARIAKLDTEFRRLIPNLDCAELSECRARGEQAYDEMYEVSNSTAAAGQYSDAKDYFARAIGAALRSGQNEEAKRLRARLDHIRAVYRSQFS